MKNHFMTEDRVAIKYRDHWSNTADSQTNDDNVNNYKRYIKVNQLNTLKHIYSRILQ